MPDSFINDPIIESAASSPLQNSYGRVSQPGPNGAFGIELEERFGLSISELTAWPKSEKKTITAIKKGAAIVLTSKPNSGLIDKPVQTYQHAPRRWTIISEDQKLPAKLHDCVGQNATLVELSHGRTIIRISGGKSQWVLAKLFAIDFHISAFPISSGLATKHHELLVQIQRVDKDAFDLIVFRSLASAFWKALLKAAGDVGYRVK